MCQWSSYMADLCFYANFIDTFLDVVSIYASYFMGNLCLIQKVSWWAERAIWYKLNPRPENSLVDIATLNMEWFRNWFSNFCATKEKLHKRSQNNNHC
jgi:hypothetical protein